MQLGFLGITTITNIARYVAPKGTTMALIHWWKPVTVYWDLGLAQQEKNYAWPWELIQFPAASEIIDSEEESSTAVLVDQNNP